MVSWQTCSCLVLTVEPRGDRIAGECAEKQRGTANRTRKATGLLIVVLENQYVTGPVNRRYFDAPLDLTIYRGFVGARW